MTNTSLRQRFGIDQKNSPMASRLLKEALAALLDGYLTGAPPVRRAIGKVLSRQPLGDDRLFSRCLTARGYAGDCWGFRWAGQ
jgi:hypothetical protein